MPAGWEFLDKVTAKHRTATLSGDEIIYQYTSIYYKTSSEEETINVTATQSVNQRFLLSLFNIQDAIGVPTVTSEHYDYESRINEGTYTLTDLKAGDIICASTIETSSKYTAGWSTDINVTKYVTTDSIDDEIHRPRLACFVVNQDYSEAVFTVLNNTSTSNAVSFTKIRPTSNFIAENIKSGVNIMGIIGTYTGEQGVDNI